ncbi:hypothetical protein LOK49_LG12G01524 [Camellia lanceoleosa]|uniref:Uncharacterized protein n=1 Tax=Camellia lanceoleosa TaxID=1840588 RepID=A0ACC0FUC3_9ERIC|nr:hypothetical protein LOK49_LG12G01524 [Camellia lanceoleosa]
MIHDNMGVSSNRQTLVYSGRSLDDDKALSFYDISRNSTLYAIFGADNGTSDLLIFVDSYCGIPIQSQELVNLKEKLEDWKTVEGYNINDGSFISLNISGSLIRLHIKVKSRNMTQNVISIQAKSSDTVNEFIAKIPQGVLTSIVREPGLFLEETRLMGDTALAYYDLHSGSFLTLEHVIQIHMAIPCKQTVKVNLKALDPIYQLKEKIEETCDIPDKLQQLTYRGDAVDDMLSAEQCKELLGSLWVLRWNWVDFQNSIGLQILEIWKSEIWAAVKLQISRFNRYSHLIQLTIPEIRNYFIKALTRPNPDPALKFSILTKCNVQKAVDLRVYGLKKALLEYERHKRQSGELQLLCCGRC